MKQFSEKEKEYICQEYLKHYKTSVLAEEFEVSAARIRTILKNKGIKLISPQEVKKYQKPRNSFIFNKIDNAEKAYWLGFLYADGSISLQTNTLRLNLSTIDKNHLVKFLEFLEAKNFEIKQNDKVTKDKTYSISYISISDKQIVEDLRNLGCIENKSLVLMFPSSNQLPQNLISHFIRGYFDGDGSIYEDKVRNRICINFTGTFDMLNNIKNYLDKSNVKLEDKGNFYVLHLCGNKQVIRILNYLYKDSNEFMRLDRKYNKFQNYLLQQFGGEPVLAGC